MKLSFSIFVVLYVKGREQTRYELFIFEVEYKSMNNDSLA